MSNFEKIFRRNTPSFVFFSISNANENFNPCDPEYLLLYTVGVEMFVITLKKDYKKNYRRAMSYSLFFAVVYVLKFECIKPQLEPFLL